MLLRFGFSNHLSIKDYQEVNLAASALKDEPNYLLSKEGIDVRVLPCVGIYGANASGKSNILNGFKFFHWLILNSQIKGSPEGGIPQVPFLLDQSCKDEPSLFDCDFLFDKTRYHYGFVIDDEIIREEWLYSYPSGSRRVLFHRKFDEQEPFYFGRHLKGKNKSIEELTRSNSLFLSSAAQNNHELLLRVYEFFKEGFVFRFDQAPLSTPILARFLDDTPLKDQIIEFVKKSDIGISDALIEEVKADDEIKQMRSDFLSFLNKYIKELPEEVAPEVTMKTLKLGHKRNDGRSVFFELEHESRGTLCLLSMIGPTLDALKHGKTIFIDEIDSSMHPLLSIKLVSLFNSRKTNPNGAQLIFTTHDTNLLCNKSLRRDAILLTEKSNSGETHIYPLSNIKTRKTDNLMKGYLQGRFGAIPFLGNVDELLTSEGGN